MVWYLTHSTIDTITHKHPSPSQTCSSICHLNCPGSIQPCCHHGAENYPKKELLLCYQVPLTPRSRECTHGQSTLPRSTTSQHNSTRLVNRTCDISLASRARYTNEPRRPLDIMIGNIRYHPSNYKTTASSTHCFTW